MLSKNYNQNEEVFKELTHKIRDLDHLDDTCCYDCKFWVWLKCSLQVSPFKHTRVIYSMIMTWIGYTYCFIGNVGTLRILMRDSFLNQRESLSCLE